MYFAPNNECYPWVWSPLLRWVNFWLCASFRGNTCSMLSIETILGEHILKRAVCPYLVPHIVSGRCIYMMYHSSLIKPVRSLSSPATQSQWPMAKMGRQKIKCVKIKNTLSSLDKQRCHKLINLYSLKKKRRMHTNSCTKKAMLCSQHISSPCSPRALKLVLAVLERWG